MSASDKLKTYADYQKYNFFRTPAWRWERVLQLVDRSGSSPGRCTRRDDAVVRAAKSFVCRRRCADAAGLERLRFENPGLFYAYEFYERAQDDPEAAMYIEARLLARQTFDQVAEAMGVLPEAVRWYSELFFDVVPYLDRRDWVSKHVIVPAVLRSAGPALPPADPAATPRDAAVVRPFLDGTLKLFAYYGGPQLVDLMIGGLQAGRPLTSADAADEWFDQVIGTTLRRRAAQAAQLFEVNRYNVMELFAAHARLMEIARSGDNQEQARSLLERHIQATIEDIPWVVGSDAERVYGRTEVGRFDAGAAELRDDELLLLSSGRPASAAVRSDGLPDRLPEPRRRPADGPASGA